MKILNLLIKKEIIKKEKMGKREVYLDNSATTQVRKEVLEEMLPYFTDVYGNASSVHTYGQKAKAALTKSRETYKCRISRRNNIYFLRNRIGQHCNCRQFACKRR